MTLPFHRSAGRGASTARRAALLAVLVATVVLGTPASPGGAQTDGSEHISRYASTVTVNRDGTVTTDEKIVYDFGSTAHHGIFRYIPTRFAYDDTKKGYDRVTPLSDVHVFTDAETPGGYTRTTVGRTQLLKIGDPDKLITGAHAYEIQYTLAGALNHFADHDELFLNVTGNGWPAPIDAVTTTVDVPGAIGRVACYAGPERSQLPCSRASKGEGVATFGNGPLAPGDGMTIVVGFPTGVVQPTPTPILEQRWSVATAFAPRPDTLAPAGALAALLVAGFVLLVRKVARDERFVGGATDMSFGNTTGAVEAAPFRDSDPIPVEFVPPDGLRPGQVGTLIDEQANTLDVTATIIDLAVRGYIRITEIPKQGWLGSPDWELQSLKPSAGLLPYESTLVTALFKGGPTVRMSELKDTFATHLKAVEEDLYVDLIANGWYRRRPDQTRTKYGCLAVLVILVGAGITAALAATSSYGLVGLPVVLLGLLLIFSAKAFPARTAKGHAALRRVLGFKQFIDESERDRARFAEQQNLFSEYLPYAVVFGAVDKWAKAFAGLDGQLPRTDWYVSDHMFTAVVFSQAMNSFTTTTSGTIASTPRSTSASGGSSGFGGGGFSGGGFGGGGGGSW